MTNLGHECQPEEHCVSQATVPPYLRGAPNRRRHMEGKKTSLPHVQCGYAPGGWRTFVHVY